MEAYAEARGIVEELAAGIPDEALRAGFLDGAGKLIPSPRPPTPRRAAKQAYDGLTQREQEVAALIAEGKSNRALADALVVSERTAAKHVENILAKLRFTSRSQIAAWAADKGVTGHAPIVDQGTSTRS